MSVTDISRVLDAVYTLRDTNPSSAEDIFQVLQQLYPSANYTLQETINLLNTGARRGVFSVSGNNDSGLQWNYNRNMVELNYANRVYLQRCSRLAAYVPSYGTVVTRTSRSNCTSARVINVGVTNSGAGGCCNLTTIPI